MAAKKMVTVSLAELMKRCPKEQMDELVKFNVKNAEYKRRLSKYPETLPKIDWEYYRMNVRVEMTKLVDEFEEKYKELNKLFDSRVDLDLSKYYIEVEKECEEVTRNLEQFCLESESRIKDYETEMMRLRRLKPYQDMTMQEYFEQEHASLQKPDLSASFWPHLPDEQTPGPAGSAYDDSHEEDDSGPPPKVPPTAAGDSAAPKGAAEGAAKGAAEGAAKGAAKGAAEGAAKGVAEGAAKGSAEAAPKGAAEAAPKGASKAKADGVKKAATTAKDSKKTAKDKK